MKTVYVSFIGSAIKTLKFIGGVVLIFCAIGSGIQIYYLTQGSSSLIALASSFEPLIIGLFGYAICAGLSSIIKHLLFIKEQQNLLLEEKGISVEFEEMPEAGLPNESEQE